MTTHESRVAKVLLEAKSVGLRIETKNSLFYIYKSNGERVMQYGVWATELFVAGYKFCSTNYGEKR